MTSMRDVKIGKITLNVGSGKDQNLLEKAIKLLKNISGREPVKTITNKRIPAWGLRPGLPVGCKITIRDKKEIKRIVDMCLKAKENKLPKSCFDEKGNVSFGIHEYIDVPGLEYDPQIGIIGFQLSITLIRPGYSIEKKNNPKRIGKSHLVSKDDAIEFMQAQYDVIVDADEG